MASLTSGLCPLTSRPASRAGFTLVELPAVSGRKTADRGFTLVELMTVIAIIAILAGLVLGISGYATKKADQSRAMADMEKIKGALEEYRLQYGMYPQLSGSWTNGTAPFVNARKRLTNEMAHATPDLQFIDPWGNGYKFVCTNSFLYTISSSGPDSSDTSDDIRDGY